MPSVYAQNYALLLSVDPAISILSRDIRGCVAFKYAALISGILRRMM